MDLTKFKSLKFKILLIVIVAGLAWSSSITNEFVGYDDIKLIVRNDKVQGDLLYTLNFYWNIVSDSHNVAWTNFPTVIYRPLEWFGSAIGYHIWGPRAWAYHFFVNFSFHILNSILLFFILSKIFGAPLNGDSYVPLDTSIQEAPKPKGKIKTTKKAVAPHYTRLSWWLPFVIALVWVVHPLHNEAVNMLTSGVGFLWSTLLCLIAITINLYVKDMTTLRGIALMVIAWCCLFVSYHGSEMTVIATPLLLFIFLPSILKKDYKSYGYEIPKVLFAATSFLTYYAHRANIVSEQGEWVARGAGEFIERLCVVAPEIFFHYIKLFFFPARLCMDEHHQVVLANAFTPYHLLCFTVALLFVIGMVYFLNLKDEKYFLHNRIIGGALFFAGFSISISLNIIPLYCLARDRYTYFFTMGLVIAILVALDKYVFSKGQYNQKLWITLLVIVVAVLGIRSWVKNWDWHDGERFWKHAVDTVDDIGTKQNWRYRLLQYYLDPGTTTFKPNPEIKQEMLARYNAFVFDHALNREDIVQKYLNEAKDPNRYILNKYGYIGNKTIASGLFFNATSAIESGDRKNAMSYFKLAHIYYPEHFQNNLQLLIHTWGSGEETSNYFLNYMLKDAQNNSFLAKGLMDGLFYIKHPRTYEIAKVFKDKFPNTQVFHVYYFHGAFMTGHYDEAYIAAKKIMEKYYEDSTFPEFVKRYDAGQFRMGGSVVPPVNQQH